MKVLVLIAVLASSVCAHHLGRLRAAPGGRIIGGGDANAGEFPFAAAIQTQTSTGQYFCGGALVNTLFIVTSGSCVDGATLFSIRLGITSLAEAGQRLATDKYVLHPLYNIDTLENDIGVIELRLPVSFTDYIQPIGLPGRDVQDNAVAIAIGWGQISDADAGLTNQLQTVELVALSNEECRLTFGNQIADTMVCALFLASKILANPDLNGRIIGGTPAHVYKLPYQVSLQNEEGHMCGGSIIHKSYILTAAHCLIGEKKLSIRAGSDFHDKGGTVRQVCAVTIHNKYNDDKEDYDYDIAILKLCQDLPLGDKILPVALPTFNEIIKDGTPVLTSGWGYTEKNVLSPQLLQVALVTVNQTTCRNNYKGVGVITGRMFCAGCKNKLCDSCQGDSGGPLFANRKLMGVVSWGYGCAMKDFPGVYTKVAKFRKWIRKEIKI